MTTKRSPKVTGATAVPSRKSKLHIVPGSETGTEISMKLAMTAKQAQAAKVSAERKEAQAEYRAKKEARTEAAKIARAEAKANKPKKLNYTVDPDAGKPMPTAGNGSVQIYGAGYLPVPAAKVRAMRILAACDAAEGI